MTVRVAHVESLLTILVFGIALLAYTTRQSRDELRVATNAGDVQLVASAQICHTAIGAPRQVRDIDLCQHGAREG